AYSLAMDGKKEEALEAVEMTLHYMPDHFSGLKLKSALLYDLGHYEEALQTCDLALKKEANDAFTWSMKGDSLLKLERYDEAAEAYDKAMTYEMKSEFGDQENVNTYRKNKELALSKAGSP
ncbi:MAG: tetratricopeptide repeat protein, partial [Methanospirillum sp.]|nr:tetratricopeptide repeat protein [Methanospirillum sp.]